jgi:hypothetical protein
VSSSSSQSSRLSSSSGQVAPAEGTSQQSKQSHLPHWPGPNLRHKEVTLSLSRHLIRGELPWRSSQRESSKLVTLRFPEAHEQRPSAFTSVTFVTCQGRRFGGCGAYPRSSGFLVAERTVTLASGRSYRRASMPPTLKGIPSSASTGCFGSPLSGQLQLVRRSSCSSTTRGD